MNHPYLAIIILFLDDVAIKSNYACSCFMPCFLAFYCITGNATGYVTTGDGTTNFNATFHACDTMMDLVGARVLQGYKGIKCEVSARIRSGR